MLDWTEYKRNKIDTSGGQTVIGYNNNGYR